MKKISFDLNNYVEEIEKSRVSRVRRRKVNSLIAKITKVARDGLEIYSSIKRKDYISLGLGILSMYGSINDTFLSKQIETADLFLEDMGLKQSLGAISVFLRDALDRMDVPMKHIWRAKENGDNESKEIIEEYQVGDSKIYFVTTGNSNYIEAPFIENEELFKENMSKIIKKTYGNNIILESAGIGDWNRKLYISSINIPKDFYFNSFDEDETVKSIKSFFAEGVNRSMLFLGPPGSGKTTAALRLTEKLDGNILILKAEEIESQRMSSMASIISIINPSVILFDDFDRFIKLDQLLLDIENMNRDYNNKNRLIIATVNNINRIPLAMRRPGRFDHVISFKAPDKESRLKILEGYLKQYEHSISEEDLDRLVEKTDNLTGAYLKEIALRIKILGLSKTEKQIKFMKKVAGLDEEEDEGKPSSKDKKSRFKRLFKKS